MIYIRLHNIEETLYDIRCCNKFYTFLDSFQCEDGDWIFSNWVCDGENDCPSGEDEENCGNDGNNVNNSTTGLKSVQGNILF